MSWVLGIDGCPQGWVVVALKNGEFHSCNYFETFLEAAASRPEAEVIAVDMPIGLLDEGVRTCDALAREFVGPRRGSVFMTPPRPALAAPEYKEAVKIAKKLTGSGISKQAYGLANKIFEVEQTAAKNPRIFECHPEVCFAAMNGEVLRYGKKSWNGQVLRRTLLSNNGIWLADDLGQAGTLAPDDVIDAAATAWTARRIFNKQAQAIPKEPQLGPQGESIAIWF